MGFTLEPWEMEKRYWDSLNPQEAFENTAGVPPYDVEEVAQIIVDFLDLQPGCVVLDLGCGLGRLTETVAETGDLEMVGVDISYQMVKRAKMASSTNSTFVLGDGRMIPREASEFDGAYSVTMFQHIPHEATWDYIKDVWSHLDEGGKFVFTIAVGDEPESFLNHQIHNPEEFYLLLSSLFTEVGVTGPDERGWTWVTCTK